MVQKYNTFIQRYPTFRYDLYTERIPTFLDWKIPAFCKQMTAQFSWTKICNLEELHFNKSLPFLQTPSKTPLNLESLKNGSTPWFKTTKFYNFIVLNKNPGKIVWNLKTGWNNAAPSKLLKKTNILAI